MTPDLVGGLFDAAADSLACASGSACSLSGPGRALALLQSAAHELVLEGESSRQRQKPSVTEPATGPLGRQPPVQRPSRRRR